MKVYLTAVISIFILTGCSYSLQNIQKDAKLKTDRSCTYICKNNFESDYRDYRAGIFGSSLYVMKKYRNCVDLCD